ncbi:MAG: phosphotransferase [bacterium]|nr:phosphotransferase [bacterium]
MKVTKIKLEAAVKASLGLDGRGRPHTVRTLHEGLNFRTLIVTPPEGGTLGIKKPRKTTLRALVPHRLLGTLLVEEQMTRETSALQTVRSYGVCLVTAEANGRQKFHWLPSLSSKDTQMCLVYEFRDDAQSLKELLAGNAHLRGITLLEKAYLSHIAKWLAAHHATKAPIRGKKRAEFYNMTLTHMLGFAAEFLLNGRKSPFLGPLRGKRLFERIVRTIQRWLDHGERISMPHGDLQPGNILIRMEDNEVVFIDFSRFPWGEGRGFDIGWLIAEFIWEHCKDENPRHLRIAKFFLRAYEKASGDRRLRQAMLIGLGIKALVLLRLQPGHTLMSTKKLQLFYNKILRLLERGTFVW